MGDYARDLRRVEYIDEARKAAEVEQAWAEHTAEREAAAWTAAPAQAEDGRAR
jgi:hypothetical protein